MTTQVEAIQALITVMVNVSSGTAVRCAAAEGLGYAGGAEARAQLLKVMNAVHSGTELRCAAARALGHAVKG